MLFKNSIFLLGGVRHRLLHVDELGETAWVIDLSSKNLHVVAVKWKSIALYDPELTGQNHVDVTDATSPTGGTSKSKPESRLEHKTLRPSPAMERVRDQAIKNLGDLIFKTPAIFDAALRGPLVLAQAQAAGCSIPTIYKHLRQYFAGGQTPSALLGRFHRCGPGDSKLSLGRGAKPKYGRKKYQLVIAGSQHFKKNANKKPGR
jgi:putative transposase